MTIPRGIFKLQAYEEELVKWLNNRATPIECAAVTQVLQRIQGAQSEPPAKPCRRPASASHVVRSKATIMIVAPLGISSWTRAKST